MTQKTGETLKVIGLSLFGSCTLLVAYLFGVHGIVTVRVGRAGPVAQVDVRNVSLASSDNITVEIVPSDCSHSRASLSFETLGQERDEKNRRVQCASYAVGRVIFEDFSLSKLLPFELFTVAADIAESPFLSAKIEGPFGGIVPRYGMAIGTYILAVTCLFLAGLGSISLALGFRHDR